MSRIQEIEQELAQKTVGHCDEILHELLRERNLLLGGDPNKTDKRLEAEWFNLSTFPLTPTEQADLPSDWKRGNRPGWENAKVDTSRYYPSIWQVYATDRATYEQHKAAGGLCMVYKDRYYIA